MDRIEIAGLRVFAHHGVFEDERRHGQPFVIDMTLHLDLSAAAESDALDDTVDYGTLAQRVAQAVAATQYRLLERLAAHVAEIALAEAGVSAVDVRVAKPDVALGVDVDTVAVTVHRVRSRAPSAS